MKCPKCSIVGCKKEANWGCIDKKSRCQEHFWLWWNPSHWRRNRTKKWWEFGKGEEWGGGGI